MHSTTLTIHPHDPQPRLIQQAVEALRDGALIAYPTDSGYAFGTRLGNVEGAERIRQIRNLGARHHFTLVCAEFGQLGNLAYLDNAAFRAIKALTPGPYTFILQATAEVPRRLASPKKKTVGMRIPNNRVALALLRELGEPLVSSTLLVDSAEMIGNVAGAGDDGQWREEWDNDGSQWREEWDNTDWENSDWETDWDTSGELATDQRAESDFSEVKLTYDGQLAVPGQVADFPRQLPKLLDLIIDGGAVPAEPTTVVDLSGTAPQVLRVGSGDPARFE